MTTAGMAEAEMAEIATLIGRVLRDPDNTAERAVVRDQVANLCGKFSPDF
jgi:glycine/serine hydroxymethyltransferase